MVVGLFVICLSMLTTQWTVFVCVFVWGGVCICVCVCVCVGGGGGGGCYLNIR